MILLPIKWFVLQGLIFFVMVAIEAGVLHHVEGIAKKDSIIYMFLVNLFSINFGWLLVSAAFSLLNGNDFQDQILSYMLLGIVSEKLLTDLGNPLGNPLLLAMVGYFTAIVYFELKMLTLLQVFVLPTGEEREVIDLPLPRWIDRFIAIFASKDPRLMVTVFAGNFISHVVVGGLIFVTQA